MHRRSYAAGAWLDITTIPILVEAPILAAAVRPAGDVLPIDGVPEGLHPVCIELCRVRDGRGEPGGLDQHAWSELAGFWWGAGAGFWSGAALGAWGAALGAARGAALGRTVARGLSETAARSLGTFLEAKVFAPNVIPRRGPRRPHVFSLGMHTESRVSQRLSEVYASGFGKRMAAILAPDLDDFEVRAAEGPVLLAASIDRSEAPSWRPARDVPGIDAVLGWLAQPLLGDLGGGRVAVSQLDRFYDDDAVRVAPVTGRLALSSSFAAGVPAGGHVIEPASSARIAGAFQATNVPVKLTYPAVLA